MATRRELRKAERAERKATKRRFENIGLAFAAVAVHAVRDKVWNRTPDATAICVEVMLFTVAAEFAQWPDDWKHKHYFGPPLGSVCSCKTCIHGVDRRTRSCYDCREMRLSERVHQPFWNTLVREFGPELIRLLEMGPPQS